MSVQIQYDQCEDKLLAHYHDLKSNLNSDEVIISNHIGNFSQEILISILSLIDNALIKNTESVAFKKRLKYLVIESIQNIIHHSDKMKDGGQLAFFLMTNSKDGYKMYTSNTLLNSMVPNFLTCIKQFQKADTEELKSIFEKNLKQAELNEHGRAGIGLLSILYKTEKDFNYELIKVGKDISILNLSLTLKR